MNKALKGRLSRRRPESPSGKALWVLPLLWNHFLEVRNKYYAEHKDDKRVFPRSIP